MVIVGGPNKSKMADGRHLKKTLLNSHISAIVRPILMKCGKVTNIGPMLHKYRQKFEFLKIQDGGGGGRHLEKSQKSRYLRNGLTDLYYLVRYAKWSS